jgi:uncharacterized protein (DUF885 family)
LDDVKRILRSLAIGACLLSVGAARPTQSSEFAAFVDRYLDDFARRHPSIAAGNGIHQHDDKLEDFSAAAVREEIAALKRDRDRLRALDPARLTADERVDRRILDGVIDGWLLEQETLENWRRNPMLYASSLSDGVHNLMVMESDPAPLRMRRAISKLRRVPSFLSDARANLANPPKLLADRGVAMMRGARDMLAKDLHLAFASDPNTALRDSLRRAADAAIRDIDAFLAAFERDVLPKANGDFTIGAANIARRYASEELIDTPLDSMLAIGQRELAKLKADFRAAAERVAPGKDAKTTWEAVRRDHPKAGDVVAATRRIVDSLSAFVAARRIATVPANERVIVERAKPFDIGFASMHASPPL